MEKQLNLDALLRKKIKNNMSEYIQILDMLSIDHNLRPENLSVKDYFEIAKNI